MGKMTVSEVKELLDTHVIPGSPEEVEVFLKWTQTLVSSKGKDYLRKNRKRIYRDWRAMLQNGLSKV